MNIRRRSAGIELFRRFDGLTFAYPVSFILQTIADA
jgi:hypothetical protein